MIVVGTSSGGGGSADDPGGSSVDWSTAGEELTELGDRRLGEDDFDGSCRCFLVAAWCFAQAAAREPCGEEGRRLAGASFDYALGAGTALLPLEAESGNQTSSSATRSTATPSRCPEAQSRS